MAKNGFFVKRLELSSITITMRRVNMKSPKLLIQKDPRYLNEQALTDKAKNIISIAGVS